MRASRSRTRDATNLLTSTADEVALVIASAIGTARDLLCLALTSRRFSLKCIVSGGGGGGPAAALELLSIVQEVARRWMAGRPEQERGWAPRRGLESWLGLMHEVGLLRLPLAFGRAHASITLSENGGLATTTGDDIVDHWPAASKAVMRSGRHFAQLTVVRGDGEATWEGDVCDLMFGLIQPSYEVEGAGEAYGADGHCFYYANSGSLLPDFNDWEGMRSAQEGDRVGLLLDLDQEYDSLPERGAAWGDGRRGAERRVLMGDRVGMVGRRSAHRVHASASVADGRRDRCSQGVAASQCLRVHGGPL